MITLITFGYLEGAIRSSGDSQERSFGGGIQRCLERGALGQPRSAEESSGELVSTAVPLFLEHGTLYSYRPWNSTSYIFLLILLYPYEFYFYSKVDK